MEQKNTAYYFYLNSQKKYFNKNTFLVSSFQIAGLCYLYIHHNFHLIHFNTWGHFLLRIDDYQPVKVFKINSTIRNYRKESLLL